MADAANQSSSGLLEQGASARSLKGETARVEAAGSLGALASSQGPSSRSLMGERVQASGSAGLASLQGSSFKSLKSLRSEADRLEAAGSRSLKSRSETARLEVFLTLSGAGLLVAAFLIIAVVFVVGWTSTRKALDESALDVRLGVAKRVNDEVAATLRPLYTSTRRLSEQALVGKASGSTLWPPTPEAFVYDSGSLLRLLWTQLEEELHMDKVKANGEGKELIPFLGIFASMAMQSDYQTPATSMDECKHTLVVGLHVWMDENHTKVEYDTPYKLAVNTAFESSDDGEPAGLYMHVWDSSTYEFASPGWITGRPHCDSGVPFWQPFSGHGHPGFDNFSWYLPEPGGGGIILGSMPLYNNEGQEIGALHSVISAAFSINPMLVRILLDGGPFTSGSHLALVSESGRLLGNSEFPKIMWYEAEYDSVEEVPTESIVGRALKVIKDQAGTVCPSQHMVVDADDRLVDALPFHAEHYGMPPLNERWCVVLSFPRKNIYEAVDNVFITSVVSGCVNLGLSVFAVGLLVASLILALKSDRRLREERMKKDMRKVMSALKGVKSLDSPMVVVAAEIFLELPSLEQYESLRDRGLVTVLDSLHAIRDFKKRNMIVFLSHQWLSFAFPDSAEGIQLAAMKGAVDTILDDPSRERGLYIWCDYTSIAQRHTKMQQAAITALPVYASMSDKFVIIAPTATHVEVGCECNLQTYNQRGWCRAEMLAKACGDGIQEMYTCTDKRGTLVPITKEDLLSLSLNIFEGEFTVPEDVENLVEPALGLYSLVLRQKHLPHMQVIKKHIEDERDKFFPLSYCHPVTGEKVVLFGQCHILLEKCMDDTQIAERFSFSSWR